MAAKRRFNLYIGERQFAALERAAKREETTKSELIRRALNNLLTVLGVPSELPPKRS